MFSDDLCMFPFEAVKLTMGMFVPTLQKLPQEMKNEFQKLHNLTSHTVYYQDPQPQNNVLL